MYKVADDVVDGMEVLSGESIDFIVFMMHFVELVKLRVDVDHPVRPVEERVLYQIYEQQLQTELLHRGKLREAVLDALMGGGE